MLALLFLFCSCSKNNYNLTNNYDWTNKTDSLYKYNEKKVSITDGVWGTLVQKEGNWMPIAVPDGEDFPSRDDQKIFPVQRNIAIYEYTTMDEMNGYPPLYDTIHTKLITTTTCDKEGFFEVELKSGKYSVFVKEKGKLYANGVDGQGGISPVTIESSKVSEMNLTLDYAVY